MPDVDDAALLGEPADDAADSDAVRFAATAALIDAAFYRARYPDVRAAEIDSGVHYWTTGWREGRDPNPWFQTDYYLRANADVRRAAVNPLWHYAAQGRREGRLPRPAGNAWREELDRLPPPAQRPAHRAADGGAAVLDAGLLRDAILAGIAAARGLVVSVSHDRYPEVPGGTQFLIADEQRKFNGDGVAYLHLSPVAARLGLAPRSPDPQWLNIILNGAAGGIATAGAVALAVADLPERLRCLLVVHNLHGHRPEGIIALAAALRPEQALFWVHDYGAICGSPRLLRNDIAFCHAPARDSMGCRICVYGDDRASHLQRMQALFQAVRFHVVAPSAAALNLWLRATPLPHAGARVHPHAGFGPADPAPQAEGGAMRVAFVGQAAYHKGWGLFRDLVAMAPDLAAVRCFHFASPSELQSLDGVQAVAAETSPSRPFGMLQALAAHQIDLVLALSPWPETFGYVAHEAIAAGADLLTTADSGNVAELVRQSGRGIVLDDAGRLAQCFLGGAAAAHVQRRRAAGRARAALLHRGSTATLSLSDPAPEPMTGDPDLHLLVAGERLDGPRAAGIWHFALPEARAGAAPPTVRLRSRHVQPAWESQDSADPRRLGVAVTRLTLDGVAVPPGDPRRREGWHAPEAGWQWTDGDAVLEVGAAQVLEVTVVGLARYWRAPLFA